VRLPFQTNDSIILCLWDHEEFEIASPFRLNKFSSIHDNKNIYPIKSNLDASHRVLIALIFQVNYQLD